MPRRCVGTPSLSRPYAEAGLPTHEGSTMPGLSEGDARLSTSAHPRNASARRYSGPVLSHRGWGGCLIPRRHLDTGNSGKGSSNEGAISYPSRVPKSRRRSGAILSAASRKGGASIPHPPALPLLRACPGDIFPGPSRDPRNERPLARPDPSRGKPRSLRPRIIRHAQPLGGGGGFLA